MYPESHWNYRVVTKLVTVEALNKTYRTFSITEMHYENEVPKGYAEGKQILINDCDMADLKGSYDLIAGAFEKPIIDLDNFPNDYTGKTDGDDKDGEKNNS